MSSKSTIQPIITTGIPEDKISITYPTGSADKSRVHGMFTYLWWKGIFDRILALLALVILSPLIALIVIAIRLDSPGDAIYRREQVGKNGQKFTAFKFRTMSADNDDREYKAYLVRYIREDAAYMIDQNGQSVYKVVDDPRVTRIGALLRRINLDELPQFINVLKGEMSIVGPRPDIPFAVAMYKDWHRKRLNVKPGITGLWQVCGRKCIPFEGMVRLDISYIKRESLLLDTKILLLTICTMLRSDGS